MRTWRREAVPSAGKVSFRLVSGRGNERVRLNLGRVSEDQAEEARRAIEAAEADGTARRIVALHGTDQAAAIRFLLGDPAALADLPPDYGGMRLAEYQDLMYVKWRTASNPRSWKAEKTHWVRILRPRPEGLGDVQLRDLEPRLVARWLRDLRVERRGGPRRGQTARSGPRDRPASGSYQRLLRAALQALVSHAWLEGHLDEAVRLGEVQIRGSTVRVMAQVDPLSLDELLRLLDASAPVHRAMWAVGAGEGLRPSELCRVRWEDVRWSSRTLAIRGDEAGEGKTELSVAEIPLTPLAHRELREWWVRQGQPGEGVAFPAPGGVPYAGSQAYKGALARDARAAGIERSVTPYLLRHSFATIAWSVGIEKDVARRMLRHVDEAMLDRVYCRPRPADLVERVAAFDKKS